VFTVLMPSANDDYSLSLSVPAIAPFVDEVLIHLDQAEDESLCVLEALEKDHRNLKVFIDKDRRLGWCEARNRLMSLTNAQHLLFIDADDIFCEWQVEHLRALPEVAKKSHSGLVMLGLMEAVGDFDHGTGRGWRYPHHDKCHAYVNRGVCHDLEWNMKSTFTYPATTAKRSSSDHVLFLHAKGVKSDTKLIERHHIRSQMRQSSKPACAVPLPEEAHKEAMRILLTDRLNPIRRKPDSVRLPQGLSHRFEMVLSNGVPTDRIDHGFTL